jgi:plastocyanin
MDLESPASSAIGKARWVRLATLGFAFAAAAPLILFLSVLAWGLDVEGEIAFFLIMSAVPAVLAFLVWRFGTWSKIVGIVLGLLTGLAMFWMIFGLFVPQSFFDFVPGMLFIPGVLLGVGCCIAALVAKRRGHFSQGAEGGEARGIRIAVTALVVGALISGILTFTGRSTAGDVSNVAATIVSKSFDYRPLNVTVAGGSKILVKNDDPFFHTFTIDELGIDEGFAIGSSLVIDVPTKPGTYIFYCTPHSDADNPDPDEDDMAGRITVT